MGDKFDDKMTYVETVTEAEMFSWDQSAEDDDEDGTDGQLEFDYITDLLHSSHLTTAKFWSHTYCSFHRVIKVLSSFSPCVLLLL